MKYYILYSFPSGGTRFLNELLKKFGLGTGTFFRATLKMAKNTKDIDRYFKECIRDDIWGSTIHWHMGIMPALKKIYPKKNNIKPFRITYEELCDDKIKVTRRILQFLEIPEKPGHGEIIREKRFPQRIHCDVRDALYRRMQKFLRESPNSP